MRQMDRIADSAASSSTSDPGTLDGASAWIVSLLVHLCVLVLLAVWTLSLPQRDQALELSTVTELDAEQFELDDFQYAREQPEIGARSIEGLADVQPTALEFTPLAEIAEPQILKIETSAPVKLHETVDLSRAPEIDSRIVVRGASTTGATGVVGAVDRITHEILLSLEQRPTLVVWIFDRSGSLARQRKQIQERFDRIYEELGVVAASKNPAFARQEDKPLLTSIIAFGKDSETLTPRPTDQLEEIQAAVSGIETEAGGKEFVFTAVHKAAHEYRKYRMQHPRRNVMLIVLTDEAGDDAQMLDETVAICRRYQMPVYVVGAPAPFGRQKTYVKYVFPEDKTKGFSSRVAWIPVDQGPETLAPERIRLEFRGMKYTEESLDSGFGPYGLTRLCAETSGMFFSVHPNRAVGREVGRGETEELAAYISQFFDPRIMRAYRPDYVSVKEYQKLINQNKARRALVEAARLSWVTPMESVRTEFPKRNEGELANALSLAQRDAASLEPKLNALYETLHIGEKDRQKLKEPRWRAGFDLAMGRVLAAKVRTEGYNAMLALAKNGLKFNDKKSNTWRLSPSDEVSTGSTLSKEADAAKKYLRRVQEDHAGTPWAMLAERELKDPLGWTWREAYVPRLDPARQVARNNNPPRQRPEEQARMLNRPRDTRKPPAL